MPFLRRAVRRAPRHAVRRGGFAGAAVLALSLLAAACGSSTSSSVGSASSPSAAASGTVNWEWELPTSWDPVTSSAGWDVHALGLVYALDHHPQPGRHGWTRPGDVLEVRPQREERDVHAAAGS